MVCTTGKLPSPLPKAFNMPPVNFQLIQQVLTRPHAVTKLGDLLSSLTSNWDRRAMTGLSCRHGISLKSLIVLSVLRRSLTSWAMNPLMNLQCLSTSHQMMTNLKIGRFPSSRTIAWNIKWVLTSSAILSRQQTLDGTSHMETGTDTVISLLIQYEWKPL